MYHLDIVSENEVHDFVFIHSKLVTICVTWFCVLFKNYSANWSLHVLRMFSFIVNACITCWQSDFVR